ncbi:3-methyl-2-oxobutanoate hydroxymethyltransferase [Bacillaceae bacterium]
MEKKTVTVTQLQEWKRIGRPIVMVTAYDFPTAKLVEQSEADLILVGDSLGMVVLGYESTLPVTLEDILHHTKAVTRAAKRTLVVADMPFMSYQASVEEGLCNAGRLLKEGLARAVKIEGGKEIVPLVERCVQAGIPVMGHIGLTPQSVHQLGGYKVQGKDPRSAQKLLDDALALEEAGAFAIVLECVPAALSRIISERLAIPTIGIGAGAGCDGQVLVFHDLVRYGSERLPRFVKAYADLGRQILQALNAYARDVRERKFPTDEHSFSLEETVIEQLYAREEK